MNEPRFEAIHNFRDCGGYTTRDGRRMRRGKLYRSAHFPRASDADLEAMRTLGLSAIVDMRRPMERAHSPSRRWDGFDVRVVEHPGMDEGALPPHLIAFERAGASGPDARAALTQIYAELPTDPMVLDLLRDFFAALAEADGAVLVHCAAGKDRTGVAVALAHHLLGVRESDMLANYLATNDSIDARNEDTGPMRAFLGRNGVAVSEEAVRVILGVEEPFLRAAFATMTRIDGSLDGFIAGTLGVTAAQRAAIRTRMLEPA
jgi:protein tyrosine/serine phosphatase